MSTDTPRLPDAPDKYDRTYQNSLNSTLRIFFNQLVRNRKLQAISLNVDIDRFPTDAVFATLRSGDVYRDTTAGDVLKVKP
jgi:hypothetical protein